MDDFIRVSPFTSYVYSTLPFSSPKSFFRVLSCLVHFISASLFLFLFLFLSLNSCVLEMSRGGQIEVGKNFFSISRQTFYFDHRTSLTWLWKTAFTLSSGYLCVRGVAHIDNVQWVVKKKKKKREKRKSWLKSLFNIHMATCAFTFDVICFARSVSPCSLFFPL